MVPFLILLLATARTSGTEIVLIVSEDHTQAIIAADSKIVRPGSLPRDGCKIHQSGNVIWAAAGVVDSSSYSIESYFDKHCNEPVMQMLDSVGREIVPPLPKTLPELKRYAPSYYADLVKKRTIISLFAIDRTHGRIDGYSKNIRVLNGKVIPKLTELCKTSPGHMCVTMVKNDAVVDFVSRNPKLWDGVIYDTIDQIMAVAEKDDPTYIGGPTSILFVDLQGAKWKRQNNCGSVNLD
jgi:hypothetical protein